jgi:hypothetical protein
MKIIVALIILCVFLGCNLPANQSTSKTPPETSEPAFDPISGDDKDSVNISTDTSRKILYTKAQLKYLLKYYPELYPQYPDAPDITYALRGKDAKEKQQDNDKSVYFGCELCQDNYYELYAYFLNLKYTCDDYKHQRYQLIQLYSFINYIMRRLAQGGTYFGHQEARILGYAEHSVYLYSQYKYGDYTKEYSISTQKKLYINSLKQYISDELSTNFDFLSGDKPALKKDLYETVDRIDRLITNYYYLNMTQEFQYSHY